MSTIRVMTAGMISLMLSLSFSAALGQTSNSTTLADGVALATSPTTAVIADEALKEYVVGKNGRTFTLLGGTRNSFFSDGTLVTCAGKSGYERCYDGKYRFESDKVVRMYNNGQPQGLDPDVYFRKSSGEELFNKTKIVSRSEEPTLVPATREQILSLAGKKFKYNFQDEGLVVLNFDSEMYHFNCTRSGCGRAKNVINGSWLEYYYIGSNGPARKALITVEGGNILYNGTKLIPQ